MSSTLFETLDLAGFANTPRSAAGAGADAELREALAELPTGEQRYWGIPFGLAGEGEAVGWLLVDAARGAVTVPVPDGAAGAGGESGQASGPTYLVFLHLCGLTDSATVGGHEGRLGQGLPPQVTQLGRPVAEYALVYEDGPEHRQPIRWRFEINGGAWVWGQRAFAARPQWMDAAVEFLGTNLPDNWGRSQTGVQASGGRYWLYALANPHPERRLRAVRLVPAAAQAQQEGAVVAVAGITAFYGQDHPLRHRQLRSFRVTLPRAAGDGLPEASIDLGVIARRYAVPAFDPEAWLAGEGVKQPLPHSVPGEPVRELILDVSASADATLRLGDERVPLRPVYEQGTSTSSGGVRVEVLTARSAWLHVTVEDTATGRATPSRVHFRAPDGRYLPPYGHRHEVNANWFEDYGADLKLHGTQYAYVDGTFQAELPVGDVYAEVFKGFEHAPLRQKLSIAPAQRSLTLRAARPLDWRSRGWVTADTHVHFISPQTAWLQGQAEGLNLINLLASQWGDLFTNVSDVTGALSGVSRDGTLVWVGTENRQHLLGHMSLLGVKGEPVFPMTTGGVDESYLGDPTWTTLSEWSDEARRKDGVVVIPHFPNPYCEVAADIVLGKIDAVELNMAAWALQLHEWYRYLSCGYRVAAVGGTDKMAANMPVGAIRTYARLTEAQLAAPFTYEAWAAAVRAGRTFTTTGPLVDLRVEGRVPGDEIQLPADGGTLHVEVVAESVVPFEALELVVNGAVAAAETHVLATVAGAPEGAGGHVGTDGRPNGPAGTGTAMLGTTYTCRLSLPLRVPGSAWIAARVRSGMEGWIGSPRRVAAHTSPVYVVAGGQELFSPGDATFMLTLLEGGLTWLDTLSIPADPERHARARRVFEDARAHLHGRLHRHGHGHDHAHGHER
jgi:hypothetical protein